MLLEGCFTADFETTTVENDCRVWAFSVCDISDPSKFYWGKSIDEFFDFIKSFRDMNLKMWFHNLKFDGFFIIDYLFRHGYGLVDDKKEAKSQTFTCLISDMGQYYSITVFFKVNNKEVHKVTFFDSMKVFPGFSVEKIAKGFNLPIRKLEIDYKKERKVGYELTQEEIEYIRNDVEIMARALAIMFGEGHQHITIASDAFADYKRRVKGFRKTFPKLDEKVDNDIRRAYRGGFTYVNDVWQEKLVGNGIVLDVNSLYPSVMKQKPMPFGEPVFFEGKYRVDESMPLFIQTLNCRFEIKKNKIPTIQLKHNMGFMQNEYVKSSHGETVELVLTKPDLELFFEHYHVTDVNYLGGWKFKSSIGLFDKYVDHWVQEKIKAGKEGNAPIRQISKLLLNSLYGRFGISSNGKKKMPYLGEDDVVHFSLVNGKERETCYIPVAAYVTSYGREKTIRTSQIIRDFTINKYGEDRYYYSDTDSIHASLTKEDLQELADFVQIDDYELGYWAKEAEFTRALYIRQKCYIEEVNGKVEATVAGMPKYLAPLVTFDNFKRGFTTSSLSVEKMVEIAKVNGASDEELRKIHHKLTYKYVKGGVILADTDFTIK